MTTTVLNTKINEVENKIPNTSNIVATTILNTKISEFKNNILMVLKIYYYSKT